MARSFDAPQVRSKGGAGPAAQRTQIDHDCLQCGQSFLGLTWAKFCSSKCRVKAHRLSKKQATKRSAKK